MRCNKFIKWGQPQQKVVIGIIIKALNFYKNQDICYDLIFIILFLPTILVKKYNNYFSFFIEICNDHVT